MKHSHSKLGESGGSVKEKLKDKEAFQPRPYFGLLLRWIPQSPDVSSEAVRNLCHLDQPISHFPVNERCADLSTISEHLCWRTPRIVNIRSFSRGEYRDLADQGYDAEPIIPLYDVFN